MSAPARWTTLESFAFGNSPAMADALGALVIAGTKTTTCWAEVDGEITQAGKQMVMLDGRGRPWAVIETLEVTRRRFDEVDAAFARDEGEGDRTLADWRDGHRRYFSKHGQFAPDMWLYCERFRLVAVLDREAVR